MASKVVDTSRKVKKVQLEEEVTHSHGGGEHSHGGKDPHTWGDPTELRLQAREVYRALLKVDPARAPRYDEAFNALDADLKALVGEWAAFRSALKGALEAKPTAFAASHPAYNYLFRRLGVPITSFYLEPDEAADEASRAKVKAWSDQHSGQRRVMLWEAKAKPEALKGLPEGIEHLTLDPLEAPDDGGRYDYLARSRANLAFLRTAVLGAKGNP